MQPDRRIAHAPGERLRLYQIAQDNEALRLAPVNVFGTSASYTLTSGTTYVFHVLAVDSSGGGVSSYTANDLVTTMSFANIQAGVTHIAFSHFDEVLTAINAIRLANGDGPTSWTTITTPVPAFNVVIYGAHMQALRTAMTSALANVSVTAPGYTDSLVPGVTPIKAQHIIELQQRAQ